MPMSAKNSNFAAQFRNVRLKSNKIMAKKALLMILDGWGIGKHGKGDVIVDGLR